MSDETRAVVVLSDGRVGSFAASDLVAGRTILVFIEDEADAIEAPAEALHPLGDGRYRLSLQGDGVRILPVVVEELSVTKRLVETGRVRVGKTVATREETVDEPLFREEVEVRRVAVERFVDGPVEPRREGDILIVPIVEEVLVVEKRLRVREELHITRKRSESRHRETVTLRSESATVERLSAGDESGDRDESA